MTGHSVISFSSPWLLFFGAYPSPAGTWPGESLLSRWHHLTKIKRTLLMSQGSRSTGRYRDKRRNLLSSGRFLSKSPSHAPCPSQPLACGMPWVASEPEELLSHMPCRPRTLYYTGFSRPFVSQPVPSTTGLDFDMAWLWGLLVTPSMELVSIQTIIHQRRGSCCLAARCVESLLGFSGQPKRPLSSDTQVLKIVLFIWVSCVRSRQFHEEKILCLLMPS